MNNNRKGTIISPTFSCTLKTLHKEREQIADSEIINPIFGHINLKNFQKLVIDEFVELLIKERPSGMLEHIIYCMLKLKRQYHFCYRQIVRQNLNNSVKEEKNLVEGSQPYIDTIKLALKLQTQNKQLKAQLKYQKEISPRNIDFIIGAIMGTIIGSNINYIIGVIIDSFFTFLSRFIK